MSDDDVPDEYYPLRMKVTPYDDGPVIDLQTLDYIREEVYAGTNAPVWMRFGNEESPYFRIDGEAGMPHDVIGLPPEWMEDFDVEDDFTEKLFLVVKPSYAHVIENAIINGRDAETKQKVTA